MVSSVLVRNMTNNGSLINPKQSSILDSRAFSPEITDAMSDYNQH